MITAIVNGKIFMKKGAFCEALLIEDGTIIKTGSTESILATDKHQEVIDLQGKTAVPGFHDSHLHVLGLGKILAAVPLSKTQSPQDIITEAKAFLTKHQLPKGSFLQGRGWNQDYFTSDKRLPTCKDLDQISTEHPIIFVRACGHMMVCNSLVLEMAGITKDSPQIDGGEFYTFADGEPNGLFSENACDLITSLLPPLSPKEIAERVENAMAYINQYGITSVQTNDIYGDTIAEVVEGYRLVHKNHHATARVYHQCGLDTPEQVAEFTKQYGTTGTFSDFGKIGCLKMLIDGSLGARTALMRKPYHDDPSTNGISCIPQEELVAMIRMADQEKMQIAIHAIGDLAIERVLDAYKDNIQPNNPLRHGIVHCQITDKALVDRFKEQDILAYVQPIFVHYDQHIVADRVGQEMADSSYLFGTMAREGIRTAYGTDAPVEDPNTMENLYTAITRLDLRGNGPYLPQEAVSVEDAIMQYTENPAYFSFNEENLGKLEMGYLADIAVLDTDIFTAPVEQIKNIKVVQTILGGKIVYQR